MIKVLHIDDNSDDAEITQINLLRINPKISITWKDDPLQAIVVVKNEDFNCIICDYQMPGMNGLEFLKELRKFDESIPFLFLTGQGNEIVAAEALRMGADDYYSKDVGFIHYERLVRSIQRLADLFDERRRRRESEKRVKQLADNAGDIIITYNLENIITYANKAALEQSGFKSEEIIGRSILDMLPEHLQKEFADYPIKDRLLKCDVFCFEGEFINADGMNVPVDVKATMIKERDRPHEILMIIRDNAEKRKAKEELEESEERFRKLFELAPEAYYIRKKTGEFIDVNEEVLHLLGYTREELLEGNIFTIGIIPEESKEDVLADNAHLKEDDGVIRKHRFRIITKAGEKIKVEFRSISTILNEEPVVFGVIRMM